MNLESINITFTYEDLRLIEGIIRSGVKENVTNYFNNEHTLQNYLDDNSDNLEMLSDLCSFRGNETNLFEYATKIYNELKNA
ncbi:MAG TPA: hypothetical protein PLW49_02045 [bacterium]|nr:hypothetical protein [bacterium]